MKENELVVQFLTKKGVIHEHGTCMPNIHNLIKLFMQYGKARHKSGVIKGKQSTPEVLK